MTRNAEDAASLVATLQAAGSSSGDCLRSLLSTGAALDLALFAIQDAFQNPAAVVIAVANSLKDEAKFPTTQLLEALEHLAFLAPWRSKTS